MPEGGQEMSDLESAWAKLADFRGYRVARAKVYRDVGSGVGANA